MSFSKRFMSKSPINKGSVAKEGKMTRTAGNLKKTNENSSDVLAALKAQLKIAKAPARKASIQKQIDKIIGQQKEEFLTKPRLSKPKDSPRKAKPPKETAAGLPVDQPGDLGPRAKPKRRDIFED